MKASRISVIIFALALSVTTLCRADQVINDDLIVQGLINETGSMCVGVDCVNGEVFGGDTLRLKENNLRLRLHDTAAAAGLGESWNITANGSNNGGRAYFNIELKSLEKDGLLISDGTYLLYDCTQPDPYNPAPTQTIPAGEPVTQPVPVGLGVYECQTVADYTVKPIVQLGTAATNGVALGYDSKLVTDAVSVGKSGLARQLKHVADGLADTDLLVTQTINDYSAYATQQAQITAVTQQLDDIDTRLDDVEATVAVVEADLPPTVPKLISPMDGATDLDPTSVTFTWRRATDPDGDPLSYAVSYCEQADFSGCSPITVAANDSVVLFAALGGGTGIALLGIMVSGKRRRQSPGYWLAIAVALAILTACNGGSSGGGNNMSTTISGLSPATLYYWKVDVSDGLKTTTSVVNSFTTR